MNSETVGKFWPMDKLCDAAKQMGLAYMTGYQTELEGLPHILPDQKDLRDAHIIGRDHAKAHMTMERDRIG